MRTLTSVETLVVFIGFAVAASAMPQEPQWPGESVPDARLAGDPAIADFDNDGRLDVAIVDPTSLDVVIRSGDGFGGFSVTGTLPAGGLCKKVAAGDLDGDGDDDLVFMSQLGISFLFTAKNAGGAFLAPAGNGTMTNPYTFLVADLNGDGRDELATHSFGFSNASAWLAAPSGALFPLPSIALDPDVRRIALGDLTQDGIPELVSVSGAGTLRVLKYNGAAAYTTLTTQSIPPNVLEVAVGDASHDGLRDVVYVDPTDSQPTALFGNGSGSFTSQTHFALGAPFTRLPAGALADVDGDGRLDLCGCSKFGEIACARGNPAGGFFAAITSPLSFDSAGGIALASVDGKPGLDVVCGTGEITSLATYTTPGFVVASGDGAGAFGAPQRITVPGLLHVDVVDTNADGDPDVLGATSTDVVELENVGSGQFAVHTVPMPGISPRSTAVGDVDGDGDVDLMVSRSVVGDVWTLASDGAGSFTHTFTLPPAVPAPGFPLVFTPIELADLDADGDLDMVTGSGGLIHSLNGGAGDFSTWQWQTGSINQIELADGDGDGDLDVFALGAAWGPVTWYRNDGLGAPTLAGTLALGTSGGNPRWIDSGDVDGDGVLDLVVTVATEPRIITIRGTGPFTFATPTTQNISNFTPARFTLHDWDGDGLDDVIAITPPYVRVLKSNGAGFVPDRMFAGAPPTIADAPWGDPFPVFEALDVDGQNGIDLLFGSERFTTWLDGCAGNVGRYGFGCAGAGGQVPELAIAGCASPGDTVTLHVDHALGGSLALLVLGANPVNSPIGASGCSLLVAPLLPVSITLPLGGAPGAPGAGSIAVPITLPPTLPAFQISLQAFVGDPTVATGYSTTQGVTLVVE